MSNLLMPGHKALREMSKELLRNVDWANTEVYADYLAQTYYYVNHSEKLLALAAALFKNEDEKLMRRFFKHLKEESAHDLLILRDLKTLGFDILDFPERVETKMFWETQYYKIEHQDPAALLGYIFFLEDLACEICPELVKKLIPLHGESTAKFLKLHGEEDPDHVEKAYEQIKNLSWERQNYIVLNYEQSASAYCQMIFALNKMKKAMAG